MKSAKHNSSATFRELLSELKVTRIPAAPCSQCNDPRMRGSSPLAGGERGRAAGPQGSGRGQMELRAERILSRAALVIRSTFVLQIVVAMLPEGARATRPVVFYALSSAMVAESVLVAVLVLRRGRFATSVAVADLAFVAVLVVVQPECVRPQDMVGTWVGWAYAAAFACVVPVGIAVRQLRVVLIGAVVLAACYLLGTLPHPISDNARVTAMTNALSILGMSVGCRFGGNFVRLMGREADRSRERERTLLHNSAPVLHLLSREIDDPQLKESAMGAAARGAQQIRAILSDRGPAETRRGRHQVRALVEGVCQEFTDLPLTENLELLGSATVQRDAADAVADALRTLLWNVRRHAEATAVIVHGDGDGAGWVITVADNGVGFDPGATKNGWGLRVQAGEALNRVGVEIHLESLPGEGTRVKIWPTRAGDRTGR